jgi:pimeloyl-ACP methyl ester carboxylesterase
MVLIGHSMGGDVIVEAALRSGDRVIGLVWVDVYRTLREEADPEDAVEEFLRQFHTDFTTTTYDFVRRMFPPGSAVDLADRVAADMAAAPPQVALDAMRRALTNEPAVVAGLREVKVRSWRSTLTTGPPTSTRSGATVSRLSSPRGSGISP